MTTRRAILAGAASIAAATLPLPATAATDPIFAAIAQHRKAEDELEQTLRALPCSFDFDDPRDQQSYRRLSRPVELAALALINTVPTTEAGVAALLWYVHKNQEADLSFSCESVLRHLRKRASANGDYARATSA